MLQKETIELLENAKSNQYNFGEFNKKLLVEELLQNIGDPDSRVRDELIYPCLAHLLYDNHFNEEELLQYFTVLMNEEHLFYKINENPLNSVLTRSFSSLQIVIMLLVHKRDTIFDQAFVFEMFAKYLTYLKQESHFEGFNSEVGWLHSIAHSADVLNQFASLSYFQEEQLKVIFECVLDKMKQRNHYFGYYEDERMVTALNTAIKREILSNEYLIDWVERYSIFEKNGQYPEMYFILKNVQDLLRSLYFTLLDDEKYQPVTNKIKDVLKSNVTLR